MVTIGVIGCGHWGPNHIRVFSQSLNSTVAMCADLDEKRLASIKSLYPSIHTTKDYKEILNSHEINAVIISVPTNMHFRFAKEALEHDKHVLCEKPLALRPEECLELKTLAEKKKKVLLVGHIFVFNLGIVKLREYIKAGELGKVQYAHSERTNLGPFRYDVNALWDLAPHDISIFNYLLDSRPIGVSARGQKVLGNSQDDLCFATMEYPGNILVNVHVSWLDPKKVRQITLVADQKMVTWDDLDNVGPIKLYDKHVEKTAVYYETYGEFQLLSREGNITIPNVGFNEPLKAQGKYFIDCIEQGRTPEISDAQKGHDVVKTLCAIQESVEKKGSMVAIQW